MAKLELKQEPFNLIVPRITVPSAPWQGRNATVSSQVVPIQYTVEMENGAIVSARSERPPETPSSEFYDAVLAAGSVRALYTAMDLATGDLANGDSWMQDGMGVQPDMVAQIAATGNFKVESSTLTDVYLANKAVTTVGGTSNYAVSDGALTSSTYESGLIVFKCPDGFDSWSEIMGFAGEVGSPNPVANELVLFFDGSNVGYNVSGGGGVATIAHGGDTDWLVLAWRRSGGTTSLHLSSVAGSWEDKGTASNGAVWVSSAGMRTHYLGFSAGNNKRFEVAANVVWETDVGAAALESVYDKVV